MEAWQKAEDQFESFWKQKTQFAYKFEDTREAMGVSGSRRVFTQARPADYLVTDDGRTFFAEVKSSQHKTSFSLSNIRQQQWHCAFRICYAGGDYFFFIRHELTQQWYRVPGKDMILFFKNKKSINWKELEEYKWSSGIK